MKISLGKKDFYSLLATAGAARSHRALRLLV